MTALVNLTEVAEIILNAYLGQACLTVTKLNVILHASSWIFFFLHKAKQGVCVCPCMHSDDPVTGVSSPCQFRES